VYHRRCRETLGRALEAGVRKVTDALAGLEVARLPVDNAACFENLNTPEEWARYYDR
jgi:molybdopterin-guanine dinucleotide biosynthesis protein A